MALNKKSMFFSIIAIALISLIIFSFTTYTSYKLRDKVMVTETRIYSMNSFIDDIEKDIERGLYISGFRSLMSMEQYITDNGIFLYDVNSCFKEAFLNGTINNSQMGLMNESTFINWTQRIKEQAIKLDIIVEFDVHDVTIYQKNPWAANIGINVTLNVEDVKKTASWKRPLYITTNISIQEFEDPLYVINSYGRVTNTIIKTNITDFVVNNDTTNLKTHVNNSYYIESDTAPSFLMRLEGNLSNSLYGIESLVNLEEFQAQEVPIRDRSVVDYIYFGNQTTENYNIQDMPSWFKLDEEHLETYECEDLTE
ncbi:MAG: hypothetical protein KKA61_02795 [Nanoarchaeota archaeon]|nr:hypothetical protein [Nanoarchaeota archaeon]